MVRFRSQGMRPINRIKHVVDASGTMTSPAQTSIDLIKAVDAPVLANTSEVITGSKVNAIYLRVEVGSNEQILGLVPNMYMIIFKNPGGNLTDPAPANVGGNDNKRYVIHQEMVMFENVQGGNTKTLFNGVIVIPKGYRRFGPNDLLSIVMVATQLNTVFCIQCHYKEFR